MGRIEINNYCIIKFKLLFIRTCLPTELFCDGHPDCYDNSDEGWCDPKHDPNAAPPCDYRYSMVSKTSPYHYFYPKL